MERKLKEKIEIITHQTMAFALHPDMVQGGKLFTVVLKIYIKITF